MKEFIIYRRRTDSTEVEYFCHALLIRGSATQITFQSPVHLAYGMNFCHYIERIPVVESRAQFHEILATQNSQMDGPYIYTTEVVGRYTPASKA